MFVECVVLVLVACVMSACALGRVLAVRGRAGGAQMLSATVAPSLGRPSIASATTGPIDDLPLVAPAGAGYGTAGRLLVLAAAERRGRTGSPSRQVPGQRRGQEAPDRSQAA